MNYNGVPYPGVVKEVSEENVFVECMKRVAKSSNNFMWPKRNKDECWYTKGDILVEIPAPTLKHSSKTHFEIEPQAWQDALCKIKHC